MIRELSKNKVYVEYGPVQMSIEATRDGDPITKELNAAAKKVPTILKSLVDFLPDARKPCKLLTKSSGLPPVLRRMLDSVVETGENTLTPMAAVAGAFADTIADYLVELGATKIIVNNGGDIAVRLDPDDSISIGLAPKVGGTLPTHAIRLSGNDSIGGVATSGLGGRSLTLGVADAVVALARNASLADACSTLVANNVYVVCPQVKRCIASEIDPGSDIAHMYVTTSVKNLPEWAIDEALTRGMSKALELFEKKTLKGSVIFAGGKVMEWPNGMVHPIVKEIF